jgi:penicillin-binding protein 2
LRGVVEYGTASALGGGSIPIAGKSGTSEDLGDGSNTWFGAFGPTRKPEIVVVAFGERTGGGGGSLMGPKVKQVIEAYFAVKNAPKDALDKKLRAEKKLQENSSNDIESPAAPQ